MMTSEHRSRIWIGPLAALTLLAMTPGIARADGGGPPAAPAPQAVSAEARQEAGNRYKRALDLVDEGNLKLALIEFRRAYEVIHDYRVLYNIAVVLDRLAQYAESVETYEQFLKEGGTAIPTARRDEVEQTLGVLRQRTAKLTINVLEPGTEVTIDGKLVGRAPFGEALAVDAGTHQLSASKQGFQTATKSVVLGGGDHADVAFQMIALPKATAERTSSNTPAWVAWGVTGGAAIATGAFALAWRSASTDLDGLKSRPSSEADRRDKASQVGTFEAVTLIGGGVTLVAAGVAIYLTIRGGNGDKIAPRTGHIYPSIGGVFGTF